MRPGAVRWSDPKVEQGQRAVDSGEQPQIPQLFRERKGWGERLHGIGTAAELLETVRLGVPKTDLAGAVVGPFGRRQSGVELLLSLRVSPTPEMHHPERSA